jgi:hypothetical protein
MHDWIMQKIGFFALLGGVPTMKKAGLVPVLHAECGSIDSPASHLWKEFLSDTNLARICLIFQHINNLQLFLYQFIDVFNRIVKGTRTDFLTTLIE